MAFKIYQVIPAGARRWQLSAPEPLLLSGRNGLIARYVLADRNRAASTWQLTPADLLRLVEPPRAGNWWIVFEQAEETELGVSRLERVTGISNHETELLLTFSPLIGTRHGTALAIEEPETARSWSEGLALDAGALVPDGAWHWRSRPLNLGATVPGTASR